MPNDLQSDLSRLVARIEREDAPLAAADPYRPYFHLAPPVGWMNDPNGLCRCGEWYHVFYQYGPFDPEGGVKHWGHYRSRDLLRWEKCPVLLFPSDTWDLHGVFSGSALVEDGVMYLYYTGNVLSAGAHDYITSGRGHNTALAVCRDGLTAETNELLMENRDYPAGLSCHVRDPKVWAQDGRYYMVQGARTLDDQGEVLVFESTDKRRWTHINTIRTPAPFGYMWECPDLFELDGQWFLCCSPQGVPHEKKRFQNTYSCGFFPLSGDFRSACTLGAFIELDCGFDFYAPQSFLDGARRIQFGWMGMPDAPCGNPATVACGWQHCLTVPCELTQRGGRLRRYPVKELEQLREKPVSPENAHIFDMELRIFCPGRLVIRGAAVVEWSDDEVILSLGAVSGAGRTVRYARTQAQTMRILADASSLEIFINHGETVLTTRYYPDPAARGVVLDGGTAQLWSINRMEIMDGISR